jgi:hypothetical protein
MRNKRIGTLIAVLLAITPTLAFAQDKKFYFSLGGGYTQPNAEVSDRLGGGYNFNIGFEVKATPVVGIEGLYSFNGFGDKQFSIPIAGNPGGATVPTDLFGDMGMQYGTASVILQKPDGGVTNIIGDRSSTDFGMSFGGGVNFGAAYAELRYQYVWGPEVQVNQASPPIAGVSADPHKATASSSRRPSASDSDRLSSS